MHYKKLNDVQFYLVLFNLDSYNIKNINELTSGFNKAIIILQKSDENISTQFKARPATVLYKKPFEPKIEKRFIEAIDFELNTERWAKKRMELDQLRKEKEEKIALAKQLEEELRLQKEEEEIARIRKEAEHKAQPIKKYKEIKIQPSGKVTEPHSPKFHTNRLRNNANKENESCN